MTALQRRLQSLRTRWNAANECHLITLGWAYGVLSASRGSAGHQLAPSATALPSARWTTQGVVLVSAYQAVSTKPSTAETAIDPTAREMSPPVLASALVTDTRGRILVLTHPQPSGGAAVSLPVVQSTGAHPPQAELANTLYSHFDVHPYQAKRLLAVDCEQWSPVLSVVCHLYLFGPLDEHQARRATQTPPPVTAQWLAPKDAIPLFPEAVVVRVRAAVDAWHSGSIAYLVGGRVQPGSPAGFQRGLRSFVEQSVAVDVDLYQAHRPKVLAEVNIVLTDPGGRALLLQPTSSRSELWELPGGGIDSDAGEGPREAAGRALRDQLGLDVPLGRLLAVDWSHGAPWLSRVAYVFRGVTLGEHDLARIRLVPHRNAAWRMVSVDDSAALVSEPLLRRLDACVTALWNNTGPLELTCGAPSHWAGPVTRSE